MKASKSFLISAILLIVAIGVVSALKFNNENTDGVLKSEKIAVALSKTEFAAGEKLTVDFTFDGEAKGYYYDANGVSVVDERSEKGKISIDLLAGDGEGRLDLFANLGGGYQNSTVFTYSVDGVAFADLTEDVTWTNGTAYQLAHGDITESEAAVQMGEFSRKHARF